MLNYFQGRDGFIGPPGLQGEKVCFLLLTRPVLWSCYINYRIYCPLCLYDTMVLAIIAVTVQSLYLGMINSETKLLFSEQGPAGAKGTVGKDGERGPKVTAYFIV